MKWPYLENLPTTTRIAFLWWNLGGPSTKSIEMSVHCLEGSGSGCNNAYAHSSFVGKLSIQSPI